MEGRPKIIGIKEAAFILGISEKRVRVLCNEKRIVAYKINNSWVFFEEDVISFSKEKRSGGRPKKK